MTAALDVAPLRARLPRTEVTAFRDRLKASGVWSSEKAARDLRRNVLVPTAIIVIVLVPVAIGSLMAGEGRVSLIVAIALAGFLLLIGVIGVIGLVSALGFGRWGLWARLDRFATANGFQFLPRSPAPGYDGAIFRVGRDRHRLEHFRSTSGRFVDFGNYRYVVGSGRNKRRETWGYLALRLDRRLPHMVLDARANNRLFGATNLPALFDRSQVLSLEGDFDRHFALYCPREYERDALYVFTPDLMALLIDEAASYDVEIVDDWMFLYSTRPIAAGDAARYEQLLRIVSTVGAKTLHQTERYRDHRATGDRTGERTAHVATGGARLRRRISIAAIATTAVGLLVTGSVLLYSVLAG